MPDKPQTFSDHVWANIYLIMLFILLLIWIGAALLIHMHGGMDEGTMDWARESTGDVLSGFLGFGGGAAAGTAIANRKAVTNTPTPDNSTTTVDSHTEIRTPPVK